MKLLTALLIALPIASYADAPKLRYNWVEKEWHYAPNSAKLTYNYMQNKYEFVAPNSKLKHNYVNNTWEYVQSSISNPYKSNIGEE
jgi:hypothetical protein